ncbi:MAG TPA: hypothetical protein VN628_15440 [Vicinamibacterales bacterium]|nr:hypothetical protein [Vicinamibacterales bacterium]
MVRAFRFASAFLAVIALAATASAQFGHPLKGSWSGDWGAGNAGRTHIVLNINWDGKTLTTALNPGASEVALKTTLDPSTWAVHFEGDGKDGHIVADGKIENLGAYARFITGTWTEGSKKGTFKVTRN